MDTIETLRQRAEALRLHGLLAHWQEVAAEPWVAGLLRWEEEEPYKCRFLKIVWRDSALR